MSEKKLEIVPLVRHDSEYFEFDDGNWGDKEKGVWINITKEELKAELENMIELAREYTDYGDDGINYHHSEFELIKKFSL